MNSDINFKLRFLLLIVFPVMFAGCSIPHTIKTSEIQQLQTGSPLKSVNPKTFAFKEFKDIRGSDAYLFTKIPFHEWKLDQPAATVVAMAIKNELERNGHRCVADKFQLGADFIIEGTVYKYRSVSTAGVFTSKLVVEIAVKLTINHTSPGKNVFVKNYDGESQYESAVPGGPTLIDLLSQAQSEMVKSMSTDLELISFLEKY
jgi:uncharacterized lipoprotein YajG